jgi:hypothetical protein
MPQLTSFFFQKDGACLHFYCSATLYIYKAFTWEIIYVVVPVEWLRRSADFIPFGDEVPP